MKSFFLEPTKRTPLAVCLSIIVFLNLVTTEIHAQAGAPACAMNRIGEADALVSRIGELNSELEPRMNNANQSICRDPAVPRFRAKFYDTLRDHVHASRSGLMQQGRKRRLI